jgi:hypothetical protein
MLRRLACVALLLAAPAGDAWAQEWHEAYRDGVKALAQGQPARAVALLEAAAAQRPQPGRNVITYGTNVIDRYHPYLRLAEAHLALRDVAAARAALRRSETWAREPAEERRALAARADELAARLQPPPVTAPASHAPPPAAPASTLATRDAPVEVPPPTTMPTPVPAVPATRPARIDRSAAGRPSAPPPPAAPATLVASAPATLEVLSQPVGASVYLDDELIGTTDEEWGRLVRSDVPPGRHRVRLALAGHRDLVEELDFAPGSRTGFHRRLTAEAAEDDRWALAPIVVAVVLLALTAWGLRRIASPPPLPARPAFDAAGPTPARGTPPGVGSPGAHVDADGVERFGEYRLLGQLGRGGMASVYRAERRGETCAIKRPLRAFLEEPDFLERFLREAEIGRTLHHPNIVRILERGEVEGVPFFTMELVPGETLQARLQREGAMEPAAAARIVVQVAEALDYAHLKGVVHRDLKPSNVMVLPDGTAKVMDYGIARARRFEGLTVTGSFLGSPEYVAPEAIEGGPTDARSDLYSLGVVFYEALTGRRPFLADTPFAVLRMHLTEPPPPLASARPGVPAALERIVQRLLAKAPDQRYQVAEELVLELRDFLYRAD